MKLFLVLIFLLPGVAGIAQDLHTPVGYLNYIGAEYTRIAKEQWDYSSAVAHGKRASLVEKRRKELLLTINEAKRNVGKMPPFNKSTALRDSVVSYFRLSYNLVSQNYAKIVDLEEVAEQSYDLMEAYFLAKELATEKGAQASDMVQNEQDRFVLENNIKMANGPESKLSRKMRKAGEVFKYHNDIYLIFFKSHKQNEYLVSAIEKEDINSIEQNRNALLNYSTDGLEKLKQFVRFSGDESLSTACREVLLYYQDKAKNKVPAQLEYFTAKSKFDKVKASFDKIKPNERTQQNIDTYNTSIKEINAASQKYNDINLKLVESGKKVIDNWNRKSETFLNTHVPR